MFLRCHGSRHQELSLTEKTVNVRETEAGGLLSCDVDSWSGNQEWRKVWKSQGEGRIEAGPGRTGSRVREKKAEGAGVGGCLGGRGGGAGFRSSSAGRVPAESSEQRAPRRPGGHAATGCDEAAALGLGGAAAVGARARGPLAGPAAWHSSHG